MKILVDCHSFDKERFQGANTYLLGVYKELLKTAPKDWVFFFYTSDPSFLSSVIGGYPNLHFYQPKFKFSLYRFLFGLTKAVLDLQVDVLHVTYKSPFLKFCKEWVTVHDVLFVDFPEYFPVSYRLVSRWLYKRSVRRADYINTISEYSKLRIEHVFNVQHVDNTGVGLPLIKRDETISENEDIDQVLNSKFILCVSRVEPRKNQDYLLDIVKNMRSDCLVVFVGSLTHDYPKFTGLYNKFNNVIWFQNVDHVDLRRLYTRAHLSIYPSFCEGFGLPPIESLLYGTPVIFNPNTAMCEYSELAIANLSFDRPEAMAKVIDDLVSKPKAVVNLCQLEETYNWRKVSSKIYSKISKL